MMKRLVRGTFLVAVAAAMVTFSLPAAAEETSGFSAGFRVGGYGFRDAANGTLSWNDCRMNGTGIFGTYDFGDHLFAELSADLYHATGPVVDHGMDRLSFHPLLAAGARLFPGWFVTPYIQAGGGAEFTRVELGDTRDSMTLPTGFMGIGGELNIDRLKLGMNIRALMMGLPEHVHTNTTSYDALGDDSHDHGASDEIAMEYEVAGQMQFFARYEF